MAAGVNIYPAEIEDVIFEPDEVTGAIDSACAEHLAGYKRPRRYIIRPAVDRDPTGKVLRAKLRDELWD